MNLIIISGPSGAGKKYSNKRASEERADKI